MEFIELLNQLYKHAANVALAILVVNIILCLFHRKKMPLPIRRLFYFLILNLLIEVAAILFTKLGMNNLPLLHLYTLAEFVLFSFLYKSLLSSSRFFQKFYWAILFLGASAIMLNSLFNQSIFEFNSLAKTVVQLTIITYAVFYFYNLPDQFSSHPAIAKGLRMINSAVLIYYSGSLFIFMCSQISFDNTEIYTFFWTFNALLNIVFQLLICGSLWIIFSRKTPSIS